MGWKAYGFALYNETLLCYTVRILVPAE